MKKIIFYLLFFAPFLVKGTNFTSVANGAWNNSAIWSPAGIPGTSDNVTISKAVSITAGDNANNVTINSGGSLTVGSGLYFYIHGTLTCNTGGTLTGGGNAVFVNNGVTIMKGSGNFSSFSGCYFFVIINGTVDTIASGVAISSAATYKFNNGGTYFVPMRILNLGSIVCTQSTIQSSGVGSAPACTWVNGTNSTLSVVSVVMGAKDSLYASAAGNTIFEASYGTASYTITKPVNGKFYNLSILGGVTHTLTFDPIIQGNLTLFPGGILATAGHNFTVGGNWTNNITTGALTNFTGSVTFNGSSTQTLGGTHTTRFSNMTISGTGNVSLSTSIGFTGVLTISNSGGLIGSAKDTMISTAAATARIAQITGTGSITASFVIQRYLNRSRANYETLASPVKSTNLGDWDNNASFWMSGTGGNDGNAIVGGSVYYSVKKYNETTNHFDSIPSDATILTPGWGVYLWMGNSLTTMSAFTYSTHGVPQQGNVSYPVTKTTGKGNGFNVIGNPYPSPISWTSFIASNPSVQTTFYIFEQNGSWVSFTSGSIPMEQGIGIVTNSATTLTFKESHKTNVDAALLRIGDPQKEPNAATFTLSNDVNDYSCPTTISFGQNYTNDYSYTEDALFIQSPINEVPQVYTTSNDKQNLCLNRIPDSADVINVPLTLVGNVAANYTLSSKNLTNIEYGCVCLVDAESGEVLNNFEQNPTFTFYLSTPVTTKNYILRFTRLSNGQSCNTVDAVASQQSTPDNIQIYSTTNGANVVFDLAQPENAVINVFDLTGRKVQDEIRTGALNNTVELRLPGTEQLYIIRVETPNGITVKKLYR